MAHALPFKAFKFITPQGSYCYQLKDEFTSIKHKNEKKFTRTKD